MRKTSLWTLYTSLQGRISKRTFLLWVFLPIAVTRMLASTIDMALYGAPDSLSNLVARGKVLSGVDVLAVGRWYSQTSP
ncbi:MAG: hypothetical protein Ct9H300mP15_24510 [Gemmatimonadota bacterium]|nr:MAG: hypothetical protein Ct9H300mP15_24510 [Gemmatimonadota bacterium]